MEDFFPMFLNLKGKEIQVFGAGTIATRRIRTLLSFGAVVTVTAREAGPEFKQLVSELEIQDDTQEYPGGFGTIRDTFFRDYRIGDVNEEADYVLAATSDHRVNETIYRECRHKEIPVNVASDKTLCDYFFPALIRNEKITIGLTTNGRDHRYLKKMTEYLREHLPDDTELTGKD